MGTLFLICAVVGTTIMVCQFALTVLGLTDVDDFDTPDVQPDADVAAFDSTSADAGHAHQGHHRGPNWLFGVISFRTVVAAMAFFGLSGLAARSANLRPDWLPLAIALATGWAAMYGVHWIMRTLFKMRSEGNARIEYSVGKTGTVYLRIPGNRSGAGKITLNLQNRTMEYQAVTSGEGIPTGANIVVVGVVGPDTVEVELAPEHASTNVAAPTA